MPRFLIIAMSAICCICASCSNSPTEFTHIETKQEISFQNTSISAKISGQYPAKGNPKLLNATRLWIAECMSNDAMTAELLPRISPQLLTNGKELALLTASSFIQDSKNLIEKDYLDHEYIPAPSLIISFEPIYSSNKLLTYQLSKFWYQEGAHGISPLFEQTFDVKTGQKLTFSDFFITGERNEIIALIRQNLWQQYFAKHFPNDTLNDVLLVAPDEFDIPCTPPTIVANGIKFTYQQYEIAPYAAGHPCCIIPLSDLRPYLRPEILPLLQM